MKKSIVFSFLILICAANIFAQTATPTPAPGTYEAEKQRADNLQKRYKDFANLSRYRDANKQLAPPAKDENRVVFMGDSITDGWKLDKYFPNQPFVNRGISGQTTPQMLLRFRPDVIDLKPKVVVILAGTNDVGGVTGATTLETIEGNLASMAQLARANNIKVVFSSILPVSDYNTNKAGEKIIRTAQRPPAQILELNKWMKNYAAQNNLAYLDYFPAMADDKGFLKPDIARDGLHPNDKGYEIMKTLAEDAIKMALKMKRKK
ncbi:MAG: SGNH/GDSL hydrolase family protein [Pyrinomonadaceae bacterium]